tara:strand:- start:4040 stop:4261 length:222 start_codon:yes stop_codon:yes gene_type:complete
MTANQKYKSSGSSLPFKEWLKGEQQVGALEVRESFSASGANTTPSCGDRNTIMYLGVGALLGIGIGYYLAKRK